MLLLVRGLPGSGKSTFGQQMEYKTQGLFHHVETDMYFLGPNGEYEFNPDALGKAHHWCQEETRTKLMCHASVIVTNTFSRHWEMQPYIRMAESYGHNVNIVTMTGQYQNIHNVPQEVIDKMRARWEP